MTKNDSSFILETEMAEGIEKLVDEADETLRKMRALSEEIDRHLERIRSERAASYFEFGLTLEADPSQIAPRSGESRSDQDRSSSFSVAPPPQSPSASSPPSAT